MITVDGALAHTHTHTHEPPVTSCLKWNRLAHVVMTRPFTSPRPKSSKTCAWMGNLQQIWQPHGGTYSAFMPFNWDFLIFCRGAMSPVLMCISFLVYSYCFYCKSWYCLLSCSTCGRSGSALNSRTLTCTFTYFCYTLSITGGCSADWFHIVVPMFWHWLCVDI